MAALSDLLHHVGRAIDYPTVVCLCSSHVNLNVSPGSHRRCSGIQALLPHVAGHCVIPSLVVYVSSARPHTSSGQHCGGRGPSRAGRGGVLPSRSRPKSNQLANKCDLQRGAASPYPPLRPSCSRSHPLGPLRHPSVSNIYTSSRPLRGGCTPHHPSPFFLFPWLAPFNEDHCYRARGEMSLLSLKTTLLWSALALLRRFRRCAQTAVSSAEGRGGVGWDGEGRGGAVQTMTQRRGQAARPRKLGSIIKIRGVEIPAESGSIIYGEAKASILLSTLRHTLTQTGICRIFHLDPQKHKFRRGIPNFG